MSSNTSLTGLSIEPDAMVGKYGLFGDVEADPHGRIPNGDGERGPLIFGSIRQWMPLADAEEYVAELQRAIAWVKHETAGGAA